MILEGFLETIPQMDTPLIAEIGMEGGGVTIFGRNSKGAWLFWTEGTSMELDENDDEIRRSWSSDPANDLELVLPGDWPPFHSVTPCRSTRTSWAG